MNASLMATLNQRGVGEGRAMTLEQAIEYALKAETGPEEGHGSASNVAPK